MPKLSKGVIRLLAVLAFVAVVMPATSTWVIGSAGRDYSRCIHACNAIRQACTDRCKSDCAALYPTNSPDYLACYNACNAVCTTESGDCKNICQQIKNNPSPTEP